MKMFDKDGLISPELRSIIENTNDLLFVKNKDFVYIAASKNYALDCVRCNNIEDVIGKTDFELFEDKAIAAQYRADDEALFASGKPMIEFRESYPDKCGKKHYCLTTKYLLHDNNGNPAAIFGQYHDIGRQAEEENERRREIDNYVIDALSKPFFAANYADLKTHKFVMVRSLEYARKMVEHCETIEQAFEAFIQTLVKPEFQKKMRDFCNSETIAQRVKGKTHIDCEYLSKVAQGWCQASFYPTEWDAQGEVTHVLFAVSSIDQDRAKNLEEGISSRKNLNVLFDVVPTGIAIYEWDGKDLRFLNTNQLYRDWFGYKTLQKGAIPSYQPIHPDDLDGYYQAINKALTETHHLEYVFRIQNKENGHYKWLQINAAAIPQENGTLLVYAIFTDITEQKEAEQEIAKKQASLVSALNAANQLCCEYDPQLHTVKCLTDDNIFHMPTNMSDYPECLRNIRFIHPEDIELFIHTVHMTDDGTQSAHCDTRALRNGTYRWYSCRLEPYYDAEKERHVVILTIIDANMRVESIQNYKNRLNTIQKSNEDALCMCDVNLTQNRFFNVQAEGVIKRCSEAASTLDEFLMISSKAVFDPEEQQKYRDIFRCQALLQRFAQGETHIRFEHFYRISPANTMMVATVFDLVKEPLTGDIFGIAYAKDLNKTNMSKILLNAALTKEYPMAALIYADTGEYYHYEVDRSEYCVHKPDYWKEVAARVAKTAQGRKLEEIRNTLTRENIISYLEHHDEFTYAYNGSYLGQNGRYEAKFRYVDKKHHLLLGIFRNITDQALYQQYKYDSEHDALTGLYNRNAVFETSRRLMEAHPDEQFVMLHIDIKHFHLYNTFFGDEAGDDLLRRIADSLQRMAEEYDYLACGRMEADVFCVFFPVNRGLFEGHVRRCFADLEAFSPNFPLELAVGAYWVNDSSMSMEAMFARATIAAKSHANNLFGLISRYDEVMEQNLKDTQQITSEMTVAIEQEQFQVYLQPKYSLRSGRMIGAEALVRWKHPKRGMISPGKFIPAFEKNGFIAALDRYMWEHVCRILCQWQNEGKPMYPISVNISRVSMYSHATVPFLKSLIEKYRLDPKYLELELTESAYMDDPEDLKRMLKELQEFNFKILMDDFGSGYSSLNTLRDLPVNILKLDMKFLPTSQNDARGNAVLSSVVRMSKLLNLPIVAEGVETQQQADYLRSIGCEYVQGFLYARPMPAADYEALLDRSTAAPEVSEPEEPASPAEADVVLEESFHPLGLLEYDADRFAYLRTNREFLKEFDLIDNLNPASRVFREHMDDTSYRILLQAFTYCSETRKDAFCSFHWTADDGSARNYHGYVHYHGKIGNYADLAVTFMNVTRIECFSAPNRDSDG